MRKELEQGLGAFQPYQITRLFASSFLIRRRRLGCGRTYPRSLPRHQFPAMTSKTMQGRGAAWLRYAYRQSCSLPRPPACRRRRRRRRCRRRHHHRRVAAANAPSVPFRQAACLLQFALFKIAAAKDNTKVKNPGDSQHLVKVRTPQPRTPTAHRAPRTAHRAPRTAHCALRAAPLPCARALHRSAHLLVLVPRASTSC